MKHTCEGCGAALRDNDEAYVCSYECTFCPACSTSRQYVCTHCGGELVRRPRREPQAEGEETRDFTGELNAHSWLIWAMSFGFWTLLALAGSVTMYQFERMLGFQVTLRRMVALQLSQVLTYAPLTPFVLVLARRYPVQRGIWGRRILLYFVGGLAFTTAHVVLRGLTYPVWDTAIKGYTSAIWNSAAHAFRLRWDLFESLFLQNVIDDITGTYVPIVLIAHVVSYYQRFRERELRSSQLQTQLAKAHLQTLKSQLQPHFLFNTMHSISALMLTDVPAADRMMTRLSDLLRMSLEASGTQITTLSHELEFLNCYLEIEKVRFEERLTIVLNIAPEALDARVPHLLLQPLVDNAVKHGISKLYDGGEIQISAMAVGAELQLEVKDNGPGIGQPDGLHRTGLGLKVTRERLEALYGQEQSMELIHRPEGGAAVRISIPFAKHNNP